MNENVIDGETSEDQGQSELEQAHQQIEELRAALVSQATKAAYWRQRVTQLEDQVLELGIRAGDIRLAEQS